MKKRNTASSHGDVTKDIGINSSTSTTNPVINTFSGPISSILCPNLFATNNVPKPGAAATIPLTREILPCPCISLLTNKLIIGEIDIKEALIIKVVMNIEIINLVFEI